MIQDHIGDLLTRIRNGLLAKLESVVVTKTKIGGQALQIFLEEGYIRGFTEQDQKFIVYLKFNGSQPAAKKLIRIGSVGGPIRLNSKAIPLIPSGTLILTTSKGLLTHKKCKDLAIGGEVICFIGNY
jgi:small subunit ribosomal protein S8